MAGGLPKYEDMTGKAKISPLDNVYSYFMFSSPVEQKKNPGQFSWNSILAWLLIMTNFLAQGVVLYAIFNVVVAGDFVWKETIMRQEDDGFSSWLPWSPEPDKCNAGGSLCFREDGNFTCAPPSVQLTGRWEELDTNGDGIWTRSEVEKAREDLMCKYAVDPVEVFQVFQQFLLKREKVIWLHPDLRSGEAIHKPYFTYAAGDIIMCGYRNSDMCPNLLQRGIFDAPIKYGTSPRVGNSIESAMDYCHELLDDGGTCDRTLPSAYATWKVESVTQCLAPSYSKFVYEDPKSGDTKSLLAVDYVARKDYEKGKESQLFRIYKCLIIGMFLLAMFEELKRICIVALWVKNFPSEAEFEEPVVEEKDAEGHPVKYNVKGVSRRHRLIVALLTVARVVITVVLTVVGLFFLAKDTDYINLLLNGVGLVFVIEIANCLYGQILHQELRDQVEMTEPMTVDVMGSQYLHDRPALKDILGFACLLGFLVGFMYLHHIYTVHPLSQALECTCLSQGDHCFEAQRYSPAFWEKYWGTDIPAVYSEVAKMKAGSSGGSPVDDVPIAPRPLPTLLHKDRLAQELRDGLVKADSGDNAGAPAPPSLAKSGVEVAPQPAKASLQYHHQHGRHGSGRMLNRRKRPSAL